MKGNYTRVAAKIKEARDLCTQECGHLPGSVEDGLWRIQKGLEELDTKGPASLKRSDPEVWQILCAQ